jgi:putative flippase GtrA
MKTLYNYFLRNYANAQFIKYLFVGALNFLFGLIIYYLLLNIIGLNYIISLSITWFLGVLLTYIINFIWVFKPENKINFNQHFLKYFIAQLLSIILNIFALHLIVEYRYMGPFWGQAALMPFFVLFNFIVTKLWSLKKVKA